MAGLSWISSAVNGALALVVGASFAAPEAIAEDAAALPARYTHSAPAWREDFSVPPSPEKWARGYSPRPQAIASRTLPTGEREVYFDKPFLGRDLLSWRPGLVTLAAEPMTAHDRAVVDARLAVERVPPAMRKALANAGWASSLLKSSYSSQYGYLEARIKTDLKPGTWPAFWLLPRKWGWPPEIDILEIPGDRIAHQTLHSMPGDPPPHPTVRTPSAPGFHTYGVLWGARWIRFYVDRRETASFSTPADMHQPMYPLLNLAIGGWAGEPDSRTGDRATMDVSYVRWWRLPANDPMGDTPSD